MLPNPEDDHVSIRGAAGKVRPCKRGGIASTDVRARSIVRVEPQREVIPNKIETHGVSTSRCSNILHHPRPAGTPPKQQDKRGKQLLHCAVAHEQDRSAM